MSGVTPRVADVVALAPTGRDAAAIVDGLRRRSPEAAVALFDRVSARVNRLVWRMLGADPEHDDVVHQIFVNALTSAGTLRDPAALDGWIVGLTVNTVRRELRRRRFRRLLHLDPALPEPPSRELDPERHMLARRFYAALERAGADERIAFTLRVVEGCALA
ncbi:MAG TPA: sigma-70 family RNA polymerase sigma factor, partial [Polyangia bacterium]